MVLNTKTVMVLLRLTAAEKRELAAWLMEQAATEESKGEVE